MKPDVSSIQHRHSLLGDVASAGAIGSGKSSRSDRSSGLLLLGLRALRRLTYAAISLSPSDSSSSNGLLDGDRETKDCLAELGVPIIGDEEELDIRPEAGTESLACTERDGFTGDVSPLPARGAADALRDAGTSREVFFAEADAVMAVAELGGCGSALREGGAAFCPEPRRGVTVPEGSG